MTTIAVIGPPGAGKGTRLKQAEQEIGTMISISTGNLLREKGFDLSNGQLVSDEIVMKLLKEKLDRISNSTDTNVVALDGAPRNLEQAEQLEGQRIKVDLVIAVEITDEEAVKRAKDRRVCTRCQATYTSKGGYKPPVRDGVCDLCGGSLGKRSDDDPDVVRKRMEIYHKITEPLFDWYDSKGILIKKPKTPEDFIHLIRSFT